MTLLEQMKALVTEMREDNALTRQRLDTTRMELAQVSMRLDASLALLHWMTRDDPPPRLWLGLPSFVPVEREPGGIA